MSMGFDVVKRIKKQKNIDPLKVMEKKEEKFRIYRNGT